MTQHDADLGKEQNATSKPSLSYKEAASNIISKTNLLLKKAEEIIDSDNLLCEDDLKKIKDVANMLNKSLKTMLDGVKLQNLIENDESQKNYWHEISRFEMLYILRHYKDFIAFIFDEMQDKIPNIIYSSKLNIKDARSDFLQVAERHFNVLHANKKLVEKNKKDCQIVNVLINQDIQDGE